MDTMSFAMDFEAAFHAVKEKVATGASDADVMSGYVAASEALRRWRAHSETLQAEVMNSSQVDELQAKLVELAEQNAILGRLESEAGTRNNQAASVNPKITASPYTNILGLQRTFRGPTRTALMVLGIVFAVLAVAGVAVLVFTLVTTGGRSATQTYIASGGGKVSGGGRI
jgi:hypothetical protein